MISYFSIWDVESFTDINDFQKHLSKNNITLKELSWQDSPLESTIESSDIKSVQLKGTAIKYLNLSFKVERQKVAWYKDGTNDYENNAKEDLLPREDRTTHTSRKGFIFEAGSKLKLVILSGVGTSKIIKADLFKSWCKLNLINYFNADLFFWLYWHNDTKQDEPLEISVPIYIEGLVTYTGTSQDEKNDIRVEGDRVPVLLATLGSIFSSKKFKHLKLDLNYSDQSIEVDLNTSGTYKINLKKCIGDSCEFSFDDEKLVFLVCFIDLLLFPKIYEAYKINSNNNVWNELEQLSYTNALGKKILNIVNTGLEENEKKLLVLNEEGKSKLFRV